MGYIPLKSWLVKVPRSWIHGLWIKTKRNFNYKWVVVHPLYNLKNQGIFQLLLWPGSKMMCRAVSRAMFGYIWGNDCGPRCYGIAAADSQRWVWNKKRQSAHKHSLVDKYGACNANTRLNIASWKMDRDRRCICYKHGKMFRSNVCLPENSWPWSAFLGGNFFGICKIIYWAAPLLDANHPARMIILSVWNVDPNCEVFPIKQRLSFPFLASSRSTSYLVSLIMHFVCLFFP